MICMVVNWPLSYLIPYSKSMVMKSIFCLAIAHFVFRISDDVINSPDTWDAVKEYLQGLRYCDKTLMQLCNLNLSMTMLSYNLKMLLCFKYIEIAAVGLLERIAKETE